MIHNCITSCDTPTINKENNKKAKTLAKKAKPKSDSILAIAKDELRKDPGATNYALAKKCEELELVNDYRQALNTLRYSEVELNELRQTFKAYHTTQIVPLALKRHRAALKDDNLEHKDYHPFVKLAYEREYGLDKVSIPMVRDINIGQIQVLNQVLVNQEQGNPDVPLMPDIEVVQNESE